MMSFEQTGREGDDERKCSKNRGRKRSEMVIVADAASTIVISSSVCQVC